MSEDKTITNSASSRYLYIENIFGNIYHHDFKGVLLLLIYFIKKLLPV